MLRSVQRDTNELLCAFVCVCVCARAHSDIDELAFRRHFEECGSVEAVRLVRDQNSGLGKGFGYILFEVQPKIS